MTTPSLASSAAADAPRRARSSADPSTLLRHAFRVNAASSTLSALVFLIGGAPLAERLGAPTPLAATAVALLGFAAIVAWLSWRETIRPWAAWTIVALDFLWVAATVVEIAGGAYSATGRWVFGAMALFVAVIAEVQVFGIRRLTRARR